jgi:hypothetical protein
VLPRNCKPDQFFVTVEPSRHVTHTFVQGVFGVDTEADKVTAPSSPNPNLQSAEINDKVTEGFHTHVESDYTRKFPCSYLPISLLPGTALEDTKDIATTAIAYIAIR